MSQLKWTKYVVEGDGVQQGIAIVQSNGTAHHVEYTSNECFDCWHVDEVQCEGVAGHSVSVRLSSAGDVTVTQQLHEIGESGNFVRVLEVSGKGVMSPVVLRWDTWLAVKDVAVAKSSSRRSLTTPVELYSLALLVERKVARPMELGGREILAEQPLSEKLETDLDEAAESLIEMLLEDDHAQVAAVLAQAQ